MTATIERTTLGRPPGPTGIEAVRWWSRILADGYRWLPNLALRYGDVVDIPNPVPGLVITLVSHPDHVDHIMTRHHHRYSKAPATQELVVGEPPALPLLAGDEWKRVRRTMNPFFGEKALASVTPLLAAAVTEQVDSWRTHVERGATVDLELELGTVVMAGLLHSMFSQDVDSPTLHKWVAATHAYGAYVVSRALMFPVPQWVPRVGERQGEAAKAYLMDQLDAMIERRRTAPPPDRPDLLDVVLGMEFDGCPHGKHARMRSELSGLVFAGFETTAEALAWTIAMMCRNPDTLGTAYAEVDELGGAQLEYEHLTRMPYLRACFDEGQRIQAALANVRTADEDDEIGGYFIPKASHVVISPYGLHRDPRFWHRPEVFEPTRFLTDTIDRNAFVPFNVGPRKCMGSRMAYIEGVLTLAAILQRYTFEVEDGWIPKHRIRVSTGLAGGLPVRLYERNT